MTIRIKKLINETFIDIETLLSMPEIDITRFGLNKLDLFSLSNMIKLDKEYNIFADKLESLSLKPVFK